MSDTTVHIRSEGAASWPIGWIVVLFAMSGYVVSTALLCLAGPDVSMRLAVEAGPIESLGAAAYLAAALVCGAAFVRSRARPSKFLTLDTQGNWWIALLAIFFFVCCGEETSWGQNYLQWGTPESWGGINAQNETNLHNLWLFQGVNPDGSQKSQLELFLYPGRLMMLLWLAYCVAIPVLAAASQQARQFFARMGLPIPPLMIGALFAVAYGCAKAAMIWPAYPWLQLPVSELQETNYALSFLCLSVMFYIAEAERAASLTAQPRR